MTDIIVIRTCAILGLTLGIFLYIKAGKINYKQSKYEFENRTGGGVVEFKNYEDSTKHKNKGCLSKVLGNTGMILIVLSIIFLIMSFV